MAGLGQMRMLDLTVGISYCPGDPPKVLTGLCIMGSFNTKTNNLSTIKLLSPTVHIAGIP